MERPAHDFFPYMATLSVLEHMEVTAISQSARTNMVNDQRRAAVFFDRDGTLIESVHYLADPKLVLLMPGVARGLVRLRQAGYACVVVSNQAAVGKGIITHQTLDLIHEEMSRQLLAEGAHVDGIYYCPIVGRTSDRTMVEHPDRKPGPGMLLRAAAELNLDLARSWMVGDAVSDVLAGHNAGCKGAILIDETALAETMGTKVKFHLAADVPSAIELILKEDAAGKLLSTGLAVE